MNTKRHLPIVLLFISFLIPLFTLAQKKYLQPEEYKRWTSLQRTDLSDDGKWVSYNLTNEHIYTNEKASDFRDTLELVELKKLNRFIYPFGSKPKFSSNNRWFTFLQNGQWVQLDLKTKNEKRLDSVITYEQLPNGMTSLMRTQSKPNNLQLIDHNNLKTTNWENVITYTLHPDGKSFLLFQKENKHYKLLLIDTEKLDSLKILKDSLQKCSQFRWSNTGRKLAFYEETQDDENKIHRLHVLNIKNPNENTVLESDQLPKEYYLNSHAITFTESENKINFMAFPIDESYKIIDPLIWLSKDPIQPPIDETHNKRMLITWNLNSNSLTTISDNDLLISSKDLEHFFWLDDSNYLPSFKFGYFFYDIIYKNGKTGETKILQEKFRIQDRIHMMSISPVGGYFTWNQDKDWWIYDIEKEIKICVTCNTGEPFSMEFDSDNNLFKPYGPAYFSKDNQNLILISKDKVWTYNLESKNIEIILKNSSHKTMYEILDDRPTNAMGTNYINFRKNPIDYNKGFFIKELNLESQEETLYAYGKKNKLSRIFSTPHQISVPRKASSSVIYNLSNFHLSPQLVYWNNNRTQSIKKSNEQQKNYYWGRSELLQYKGPKGNILKGTLFYPGNYNPQKKYPVIFKIYSEVALHFLKTYVQPTLDNYVAWNTTILTSQDYFVFMPDIEYEINYTGQSALQCVLAGVEAIRKFPSVDTTRMGLFGQSFGGFEVSYIATQTDIFKAIFSSAGWHDLVDTYTTIDDNRNFNYFRFEHQQLRISAPYYSQIFLDNSPILQAHKINTPMLLLAGTKDRRVYWENSMKMQLALTRLNKESSLLLYKDEHHIITKKENRIDASKKMLEWFNHHLKEKSNPSWNR